MERRTVVQILGASAVGGLSGCAGIANQYESDADGSKSPTPNGSTTTKATDQRTPTDTSDQTSSGASAQYSATTRDGAVASASVPSNPSNFPYATMGSADAGVNVTFYGSWKCPYTKEFVVEQFGELVTTYVQPGDVNVTFRALGYKNGTPFLGPDAPRAARTGLAVWNADPKSFWQYFATVFASQPPESADWATTAQLMAFAEAAGVSNRQQVRSAIESNDYSSRVKATTEAVASKNIETVPRLMIDGDAYAPNLSWERVRSALDAAVGGD